MGRIQNEPICQEPLDIQLEKERRERKLARKEARIQLWKESGYNVEEMLEERMKRKAEKRKVAQEEVEASHNESVVEVVEVVDVAPSKKKSKKAQVKANCTEQERAEYLKKHNLTIEGRDSEVFMPFRTFDEAQLPDYCKPAIETFTCPTPIQAMCMPIAMSGRDLIGVAETGSGKTLAFGLPSIYQIKQNEGIKVLVMSPTRELTMQIAKVYESITDSIACIYGGAAKEAQLKQLRKKPSIVVATPGRLIDFISEGKCDLSKVTYVVLDEADRMLDIGFEEPIRKILGEVKGPHQTLMFTATWPTTIQALASTFMNDPVKVVFGKIELAANKRIKQVVDIVRNANDKPKMLQSLMQKYHVDGNRILVFVLYKREAPLIDEMLSKKGYKVVSLHGNCSQAQRTGAINSFRDGTTPILVATDVAARGLDVDDVEYVINYSMPLNIEDYVHRIGRTARAGKHGVAHTFFSPTHDKLLGFQLASILRDANQEVPEHLLTYHARPTKVVEKTCNISEIGPSSKIVFDDSD